MSVAVTVPPRTRVMQRALLGALCAIAVFFAFRESLAELVARWIKQDEYGHGFLIPLVSLWLLWSRRDALRNSIGPPSWLGPALLSIAAIMAIVGELSALFVLAQLGFILALCGIVLSVGGRPLFRLSLAAIVLLIFAIPLPYFLESILTWRLQLISSALGVGVIKAFHIPVYLEGNVIDLGAYQLQVIEACSGLRYLYPLMSLGFLAAYFFEAPLWQRALVFLSSVPITILMNSLRIGLVGVLVNYMGTSAAEGMLHFFEGWIVFLSCAGLLMLEIYLLARIVSRKPFFEVFGAPRLPPLPALASVRSHAVPVWASLLLAITAALFSGLASERQEFIPERLRFVSFPTNLGRWQGHASLLEPQMEHALGLDDYILADYKADGPSINLYVAYYASQRKGSSPHSPIVCMPGGGWKITKFVRLEQHNHSNGPLQPLNRAVIERGSNRQLVYYWFVQRGRPVANEYWSKWYLFADALVQNRTDGALVRLTTPLQPGEPDENADLRLRSFMQQLQPRLAQFLPSVNVTTKAVMPSS